MFVYRVWGAYYPNNIQEEFTFVEEKQTDEKPAENEVLNMIICVPSPVGHSLWIMR